MNDPRSHSRGSEPDADPDSTRALLDGAREGRPGAMDRLARRYRDRMRRWASGRLPGHARRDEDTDDLVQDALVQTLNRLSSFEHRADGAFHSYLRTAILNRIRNRVRDQRARDRLLEERALEVERPASPLEHVVGVEALARYEAALSRLSELDRELVVARIEMDCTPEELAELVGKPTANAARVALQRALVRLAQQMDDVEAGREGDGATA